MTIKEILQDPQTSIVDVRSVMEFNSGHIDKAINIPLDQFVNRYREIKYLGEKPVVFYCRSGNRSAQAVAYLQQQGIKQIYNGGGLEDVYYAMN